MIRRAVAWGAIPLIVLGATASCGEEPITTRLVDSALLDADGVTIDGEYTFTTAEGIVSSHLTFDTLFSYNDSTDSELRGLELTINNTDGSPRAVVTAREGTADPRFEALVARRNVVALIPSEGRRLETEHLEYDPGSDRISGNACFVMFQEGEEPFRGTSFTSDLEFRNFTFVNDPTATRPPGGCP